MGKGEQPVTRMVDFMLDFNSKLDTNYLRKVLKLYISECALEGVNYDVAVCQMCLETGFLRFNGSVSRFQNNYCGLGAINSLTAGDLVWIDGGGDQGPYSTPESILQFGTVEDQAG